MRKPIILGYILLVLFAVLSLAQQNYEFLIYTATLIPVVIILHLTDKKFNFKPIAIYGFVTWMLLHLLGGLTSIGSTRLYDYVLIPLVGAPYEILKYDQAIHFFCYFVIAMLLGSVLMKLTKKNFSIPVFSVILVLASTGVGAINEIIEFLPVVLFNSPGPGGYVNTALDIIMNFLGAILGTWVYLKK